MVGKKYDKVYGWLFILPVFILAIIFFVIPAGMSLMLSFKEYSLLDSYTMIEAPWVGLKNYRDALNDEIFFKSLKNTVTYALGVVPSQLIIALGLAVICNSKIRNKGLLRTIYYIPTVTSAVAVSIMFLFLYKTDGLLNKFLEIFGIAPIGWFNSPAFALPSMMSLAIWSSVGIYMVIFLAGLQGISPSLYEAADIDGASKWEQFLYITLPQLKHVLFFNLVVSFIGTLQVFDQAYVISGGTGGPLDSTTTVVLYLFNAGFRDFRMGYASAIAFILFGIIFTLTMIQKLIFKESD